MKTEYKGYSICIERDDDPISPRKDDNLGTMILFHKRYVLGDTDHGYNHGNYSNWSEMESDIYKNENPAVCLSVYGYSHGGITIKTSPFWSHWDSGKLGFIFVSKEKLRKEFGKRRISSELLRKAAKILIDEVSTYDQYLQGEIYGYIIKDGYENEIDSCWGFYGQNECEIESRQIVDSIIYNQKQIFAKIPCCQP